MSEKKKRIENNSVEQNEKKERKQDISPQRDPDKNDPPKK
ncbi:3-methyladenine DNA glycosylase [Peribacillus glennii]|uniref:3-methyladenine DNA glycosylase n=1 Tax=Peribacillus glennii TaxID=2303991 RepID=A0A372LJF2_9BACI|nr:3-methyladenine DNA glycosylase [Peribacillus glennii]RFU66555.1 3-methyladenine DNA glycosylase [Peribacillus glennii]